MTDTALSFHHVSECASTQQLALAHLARAPEALHVVRADTQHAGHGRQGRVWENPPGAALLMSIAWCPSEQAAVLDGYVRRVVDALAEQLTSTFALAAGCVAWDAPNDLVDAHSSAKLAGVLVDARTIGDCIDTICVGIGVNVTGSCWVTAGDARDATSVEAIAERPLDACPGVLDALAQRIARSAAVALA